MRKFNLGTGVQNVHFTGIGGVSMSGLAAILQGDGYTVSGSDWEDSTVIRGLRSQGINVAVGHRTENLPPETQLLVYTAAVKADNPELAAARARGIEIMDRARLLGRIMGGFPRSVAVTGTHGKTTTTAVVSTLFLSAGLDPTVLIGGYMESLGGNYRVGASPYMVAEACEYVDSFLQFFPCVGVILNVNHDHVDYFKDMAQMVASYRKFAQNISPRGALVIHGGIPYFAEITAGLPCEIISYGTPDARFRAHKVRCNAQGLPTFEITDGEGAPFEVSLQLRGLHNIDNTLAAAAVGTYFNLSPQALTKGFAQAAGAKRRYETIGEFNGVTVVDDYAHHPAEIQSTLAATKACGHARVIVAFQSHTYSRTEKLLDDFAASFTDADVVLVLPLYVSREAANKALSPAGLSKLLAEKIARNGKAARFVENFSAAAEWLYEHTCPGDLLITMGAGDVHLLAEQLVFTP